MSQLWFEALGDRVEAESYGHPFGDAKDAVSAVLTSDLLDLIDVARAAYAYIAEPTKSMEDNLAAVNLRAASNQTKP